MPNEGFLGYGLLSPFRRDGKGDFAHGGGRVLIESSIRQILGTKAQSANFGGELPWRTNAGSKLYLIRHRNNNKAFREIARVYIQEALRKQEPRVSVVSVDVVEPDRLSELNKSTIKVRWQVIDRNVPNNRVIYGPVTTEVIA